MRVKAIVLTLLLLLFAAELWWIAHTNFPVGRAADATKARGTPNRRATPNPSPQPNDRLALALQAGYKLPQDPLFVADGRHSADSGPTVIALSGIMAADLPSMMSNSPRGGESGAVYYFVKKYFQPAARFKLYRGGAPMGEAVIKAVVDPEVCGSRFGQAEAGSEMASQRALATNNPNVVTHEDLLRQPTSEESEAALAAARNVFSEQGVSAAEANQATLRSLTATVAGKSGERILVGSFQIAGPKVAHKIFMILGGPGEDLQIQYQRYEKMAAKDFPGDLESWLNFTEDFVDQLDLDGDGVDELVTEQWGDESSIYFVYTRKNGHWVRIFEGGEEGC